MNKPQNKSNAAGFTIIELLIATTIFSLIMVLITVSILQFTKQYYKGRVSSATQSVARATINDVSRAVQFNSEAITALPGGYCVGSTKRYSFNLNTQVTDGTPIVAQHQAYHGLVSDVVTGCGAAGPLDVTTLPQNLASFAPALNSERELLGENMRLAKFSITDVSGLYTITIRVIYGDDDLLCSPSVSNDCDDHTSRAGVNAAKDDLVCRSSAGSQYCAVSELTTTVKKRVNS